MLCNAFRSSKGLPEFKAKKKEIHDAEGAFVPRIIIQRKTWRIQHRRFAPFLWQVSSVGFQFERAVLHVPSEGKAYQSVAWSYVNNDTCVGVFVRKLQLSAGVIPVCFFESLLEDGRLLVTSPSAARADSTEILRENQIDEMSVEAQYRAHL